MSMIHRTPSRPRRLHRQTMLSFVRRVVVLVLWPLGLMALMPAVQAATFVSIAKPNVMWRDGPGTEWSAPWKLGKGFPLKVIRRQGAWLKVRDFENDTGWVYRPLTSSRRHHIVRVSSALVRRGPGTRHPVVGRAQYGDILQTTETRAKWVKVRGEHGLHGWVARKLLWGW